MGNIIMSEPEKNAGKGEEEVSLIQHEGGDDIQPTDISLYHPNQNDEDHVKDRCHCCCCFCNCSNKRTRDLSCFGCFPIKCAIILIGLLTITLNFCLYVEVFYCLMSDTIAWWYVLVGVVLLIPLFLASTFFILFFADEDDNSRGKLATACILSICSLVLLQAWNLTYFLSWYKSNQIYFGTPRLGYTFSTKKAFLFWNLFITAWIVAFYGYWLCVCRRYKYALRPKEPEAKSDDNAAAAAPVDMEGEGDKKEGEGEAEGDKEGDGE